MTQCKLRTLLTKPEVAAIFQVLLDENVFSPWFTPLTISQKHIFQLCTTIL